MEKVLILWKRKQKIELKIAAMMAMMEHLLMHTSWNEANIGDDDE